MRAVARVVLPRDDAAERLVEQQPVDAAELGGGHPGQSVAGGRRRSPRVYGMPTSGCEPYGIALGPDGALWTALEIGALARVAPARDEV